ncbi:MAG: hypothetical protein S4CHLAM6_12080 [Chlamydiae bacterium]|nr:hypothetical protein [Chlamydiota bacterium]
MSRKKKTNQIQEERQSHLTIVEAVENLSSLAEMDSGDRIGIIEDHVIVHDQDEEEGAPLEAIHWLEEKSQHQTEEVVADTFKTVLKYVKNFHKKEFNRFYEDKNQTGLKKIMLLVGKASDNLKNYTHLFSGSHKEGIEQTREYKQLSNFYKERIAIEDEDKVSLIDLSRKERKLELTKHPLQEEDEDVKLAKQFIFDVEKVKVDDSYELLYMQREDGTRFFNRDFYRNLKLACNFGEYVGAHLERDPTDGLYCWLDRSLQKSAVKILKLIKPHLKPFYQESTTYRDMEMVGSINMALMALMMAANPKNKRQVRPIKTTVEYFKDFQHYVRLSLESFEYHKLKSFPPPSSNIFLHNLIDVIHLLSWSLFFQHLDIKSLGPVIDDIVEEGRASVSKKSAHPKSDSIWEQFEENYTHICRYLMNYPVGPLFQTLYSMNDGVNDEFDTLMMNNFPVEWGTLKVGKKSISMLRLPSPTNQELVNKVNIDHEFVGLLDAFKSSKESKKHLMINVQDRTIWKEYPRAKLLEDLPKQSDYYQNIDVVTLCKESDFYQQKGAYKDLSSMSHFFKQIVLQLHSPETGFYFPGWIDEQIFNGFVEKLIQQIHRFFFDSKSKLDQKERQDFIEIFYQFLTLKLIEICSADSFSFTCKDGLDSGAASTCSFFAFMKVLTGENLSKEDKEKMNAMLFAFPMIVRQRSIKAEHFNRMVQCHKRIEKGLKKHSKGRAKKVIDQYFGSLYNTPFEEMDFGALSLDRLEKK